MWPLIPSGYIVPVTWLIEQVLACGDLKYSLTIYLYNVDNIYGGEEILNPAIYFYIDAAHVIHPLHTSASHLLVF